MFGCAGSAKRVSVCVIGEREKGKGTERERERDAKTKSE